MNKKTVKITENELINLIDNIVNEAVAAKKAETKKVEETKKKVVKIKESELIDMIENIVNEAIAAKKAGK